MTHSKYFQVSREQGVLVLRLSHEISSLTDDAVLNEIEPLSRECLTPELAGVVVDFGQTAYFGSCLLEALRLLWTRLEPLGKRMALCHVSPVCREILDISRFDRLWPVCETRTQAVNCLHNPSVESAMTAPSASEVRRLIEDYAAGPQRLRESVAGLSAEQLRTRVAPGKWSILEVVCHVTDAELVYADRLKRILAENEPLLPAMDPDQFADRLAYDRRDLDEELTLVTAIRGQIAGLLETLQPTDFTRMGRHSADGPLTFRTFLERITNHIPHHVRFIEEKKQTLQVR